MATTGDKCVTIGGRPTYDIIDDDDMSEATAYNIPSAESVKAYVDTKTGTLDVAEIAVLDGATPGTITASKAVVAGTDGKIGAATFDGAITTEVAGITSVGVGAKAGGTVTVVEQGCSGAIHKTVLTLTATPITLTDEAGVGQFGGVKIYDMPAGNNVFLGATIDADLTLTNAAWTDTAEGDVGLGTTAVTDGNALATTEQNIIATTAIAAMTAQVGPINASSADVATVAAAGTTDTDIYLNVRIDDAEAHITDGGTITGTVTIVWANLGDF